MDYHNDDVRFGLFSPHQVELGIKNFVMLNYLFNKVESIDTWSFNFS